MKSKIAGAEIFDPDNINELRVQFAKAAIAAFMDASQTDAADALVDLLTDLMHLADHKRGWDFERSLKAARGHYGAEISINSRW